MGKNCILRTGGYLALLLLVSPAGQAQQTIFADSFEIGNVNRWSITQPQSIVFCDCYFSGDCFAGNFCSWGPMGPSTVDICAWMDPKPSGVPGTGCNIRHQGPWGAVCDGYCIPSSLGSTFGLEDQSLVRQAIGLWADAMLVPSEAGGGPMDPALAEQALSLGFQMESTAVMLGRHVADTLALTADPRFYDYFCHYELSNTSPSDYIDLSGDPCRANAARLTMEALLAELASTGSGAAYLERIPEICTAWQWPEVAGCGARIGCTVQRVGDLAVFLSKAPPLDFGRSVLGP